MGRFAADYEGWTPDRLRTEEERLVDRSRTPANEKKRRNIQERLDEVRGMLQAAGHVQGPAPTRVAEPSRLHVPSQPPAGSSIHRPAPAPQAPAPKPQGRGPMGPVGVELDQELAGL